MNPKLSRGFVMIALAMSTHYAAAEDSSGPGGVSALYSDVELRAELALEKSLEACTQEQCELNHEFDARVTRLGEALSVISYALYPTLEKQIPHFEFSVADKEAVASASNVKGKVVLFRGLQTLDLSDQALSFVLAREMGHIIMHHHDTNVKTKLLFTVAASILFPAIAIVSATSAAAQTSTAVTSLASTATSYVGSEVVISQMKPKQLIEADDTAIKLVKMLEMDILSIGAELALDHPVDTAWLEDLNHTSDYLYASADKAFSESEPSAVETDEIP